MPSDEEDPLDVDMSGSRGEPRGVALVLESAGELMREMPEDARYDFELRIEEVDD